MCRTCENSVKSIVTFVIQFICLRTSPHYLTAAARRFHSRLERSPCMGLVVRIPAVTVVGNEKVSEVVQSGRAFALYA